MIHRRTFLSSLVLLPALISCGEANNRFQNTDLSQTPQTPLLNLVDASGRPRNLEEFRGKVVLLYFGYTSCPEICPAAMRKFATVMRHLNKSEAGQVQLLFVTLDPARDTPEKAGKYAQLFNPGFIGLSGSESQIAEAVRTFQVTYSKKELPGGNYMLDHSAGAYAVDPAGKLRLHFAENALIEPILGDIRLLLSGK
jgi:protein SCO1